MSRHLITLAAALTRTWTRLYTSGLPPLFRDARRREVACDLYELTQEAAGNGESSARTAFHILARVVLGAYDDVTWRFEHLSVRHQLHAVELAIAAFVVVLVAVASFMYSVMRVGTLPTPPRGPAFVAVPPPPPPVPPSPPPPPSEGGH